jgi:ATP synthase protein I
VTRVEPERELVRRVLPFVPLVAVVAVGLGYVAGGADAAWSAAIGIAIVTANFLMFALSIAWAATISPTMIAIVALGGYLVRLIVFTVALVILTKLSWFSPVAFALTLVPATIALLVYEAKALSGRMQADLWTFAGDPT